MPPANTTWKKSGGQMVHFLFIGRLTKLKGLQDVLKILPDVAGNWRLDVVGDGPFRGKLEEMVKSLGLIEKVKFHGFRNDPDTWMERGDCLLFPSHIEGMPLTLARAIQIGIPVIASDIEPVREMSPGRNGLVKPGDLVSWKNALVTFLATKISPSVFDKKMIPSVHEMTQEVQSVYQSAISGEDKAH